MVTVDESRPALDGVRCHVPLPQQVEQHFSSARRFGGDQGAPLKVAQECRELGRGFFGALIDTQRRRAPGHQVVEGQRLHERIELHLRQLDAAKGCQFLRKLWRGHEYFGRTQDRPLRVVAALHVATFDIVVGLFGQIAEMRIEGDRCVCGQIIEERGRGIEK